MRTSMQAPSRLAMTLSFNCLAGILCCLDVYGATTWADTLAVEGVHVVPHQQSREMRYRQKTDFSLGARLELFLHNTSEGTLVLATSVDVRLRGRTPSELLQSDDWAWHDFPSVWGDEALRLPPGALTVWNWNGKRANWGTNTSADLTVELPGSTSPERFEVVPAENISADGFVDVHAMRGTDGLVYLARKVKVSRAGEWALHVGHDGGARVFVDGKPVAATAGAMSPAPYIRTETPVKLAKGEHEIVVALDRAAGKGWGIFVSFAPAVGKAKAGAKPAFPC